MRIVAAYLFLQGCSGIGWWVGLLASSTFQERFVAPGGWPTARTVLVADIALFGGGSILAGLLVWRGHRWSRAVAAALVGVVAYATAVSVVWVSAPVDRSLGGVLMGLALVGTCGAAVAVHHSAESSP